MENPFAEALKVCLPETPVLLFEEQCAFYAALKLGVPPLAVASAAGLSPMGVSHLTHAGKLQSGEIRYRAVAREYADTRPTKPLSTAIDRPRSASASSPAIDAHKCRERDPRPECERLQPARHRILRSPRMARNLAWHARRIPGLNSYPTAPATCGAISSPSQGLPEFPSDRISYDPAAQLNGDPSRGPERGPNARGFATSKDCFFRDSSAEFNPADGIVKPNTGFHDPFVSPPSRPLALSRGRIEP